MKGPVLWGKIGSIMNRKQILPNLFETNASFPKGFQQCR